MSKTKEEILAQARKDCERQTYHAAAILAMGRYAMQSCEPLEAQLETGANQYAKAVADNYLLEARIAELEAGLKGLLIHNPKDNWEDYTQKWDAAKQLLNPTNDKR